MSIFGLPQVQQQRQEDEGDDDKEQVEGDDKYRIKVINFKDASDNDKSPP